jgi:type IV secretory pathway protease TraF
MEEKRLTREDVEAILRQIILDNTTSGTGKRSDKELRTRTALQRCTLEACRLFLLSERQKELELKIDWMESVIKSIKMASVSG